jgi:hypothetical protein
MAGGELGTFFSEDPAVNTRFFNWNVAYAKYCDGASFSGNRSEPVLAGGKQLYFRGARIFHAIVESLRIDKGMANASEGLLSGCSAGGLATYLHCDAWAELIAPIKAKCAADAGYFANIPSAFGTPTTPNPRNSIIEMEYTWIFENQHSNNSRYGVNQNCLDAMGHYNPLCFFPENSLQYMRTPLFILNSGYDSWQTNFIWFTPNGAKPMDAGWHGCAQFISQCNQSQLQLMDHYHAKFVAKLKPMTDPSSPHGGFVESCMSHCQGFYTGASRNYNHMSAYTTFAQWYDGNITAKAVDQPYLSGKGACAPP